MLCVVVVVLRVLWCGAVKCGVVLCVVRVVLWYGDVVCCGVRFLFVCSGAVWLICVVWCGVVLRIAVF